jgi:hypothetical protein
LCPSLFGDHPLEQRRRRVLVSLESWKRVRHGVADVEADHVGQSQWTHRVSCAEPHAVVDVLPVAKPSSNILIAAISWPLSRKLTNHRA